MYRLRNLLVLLILIPMLMQCEKPEDIDPNAIVLPDGTGYEFLSEYNFFEGNLTDLIPNSIAGVVPYDLNMALFSDYASKKRFVYVPDGSSIPFDTTGVLNLPTGSVLIKHFYYPVANGGDNYIETRLLIKRADGWQAETYEWNESQTDAQRTVLGGSRSLDVAVNGQNISINYLIPNVNQCKNCHASNGALMPIGPTIHNLNKDYGYSDGTSNQIEKWIANGILAPSNLNTIPSYPQIDDMSASLNDRARAYLAVNCSSCHSLEGSAANSGLYLEYSNHDSLSLGFFKTPVAAGAGSGGFSYVIDPGNADESILLYRMISDQVDARMPEIGRSVSHDEGIALIEEWINSQ